MDEERNVWQGTPSQVVNLGSFILLGLFFWLVIPLFVMLWRWLVVKSTKYELTTERLRLRHGVFNKVSNELELYRVRDYVLEQPFFLRVFSLSNIVLTTSDKTHPRVVIEAIKDGEELREKLRKYVELCRTRKGVREIDIE
ncbi:MAG TPA: PH domain-containing protein [Woeseiaceae bacterium]